MDVSVETGWQFWVKRDPDEHRSRNDIGRVSRQALNMVLLISNNFKLLDKMPLTFFHYNLFYLWQNVLHTWPHFSEFAQAKAQAGDLRMLWMLRIWYLRISGTRHRDTVGQTFSVRGAGGVGLKEDWTLNWLVPYRRWTDELHSGVILKLLL